MKTDILTASELFQKDVRYTIPPFQRHYVWSQEEQWEPFWEDIRNVAEHYLEQLKEQGNDGLKARKQTRPHFFGAIVLKKVDTTIKELDQQEVIDGQQRITTLQLLLDAIQQVCEDLAHESLQGAAVRLSKYVTNNAILISGKKHHIFKLWPTRNDREAFRHAMDNSLAVDDHKTHRIVEAHEFFKLQVRNWIEEDGGEVEQRIDALEETVTTQLQMVVIELNREDDPHLIFETLNARGTPLRQSDLIKNYVLSLTNAENSDIWGNLGDDWWREEVRQGRLYRPRVDMLLNYWMAMRTGSEVFPLNVFDKFRDYVKERDVLDVMSSVKRDFENYKNFEASKDLPPEEESFRYRTSVMQAGAITPVLLLLLSAGRETRIVAFKALESFLVRRMIRRLTTKDYNRLTLELSNRLQRRGLEEAGRVTIEFLGEQTANAREWPSDRDIADAMESSQLFRLLTRGRLRLVLEGIEELLRSSRHAEQTAAPRNQTIEHVMPVNWRADEWPLPKGLDTDAANYERNTLIHTIGNLTLVTHRLNASMSNSAWGKKRCAFDDHSVLLLNRDLLSQPTWDEETIRSRSRRLAKLVSKVWPGPESEAWR